MIMLKKTNGLSTFSSASQIVFLMTVNEYYDVVPFMKHIIHMWPMQSRVNLRSGYAVMILRKVTFYFSMFRLTPQWDSVWRWEWLA